MTDDQTRLTRCWEMMTEVEQGNFWQVGMWATGKDWQDSLLVLAIEGRFVHLGLTEPWGIAETPKSICYPAPCPAVWWRIEEMMGEHIFSIKQHPKSKQDKYDDPRFVWWYETDFESPEAGRWGTVYRHDNRSTALLVAFEAWLKWRGMNRGG